MYLKIDVYLLANVFKNFKKTSQIYYIDHSNACTEASLLWSAMLKITGVNLMLLTDIDQYLYVENGKEETWR